MQDKRLSLSESEKKMTIQQMLNQAMQMHETGDMEGAEALYAD